MLNAGDAEPALPSMRFARRLLTIGENRLELFMLEVQEERERILSAVLLAAGMAVFGFLTGAALTVAVVVLLWHFSPVVVLLSLAALYAAAASILYQRFKVLQREWKTLPATIDQLGKDRACLAALLQ
jgi:uncharacterized membrane protein YqjE